jgi:hypothetical protein
MLHIKGNDNDDNDNDDDDKNEDNLVQFVNDTSHALFHLHGRVGSEMNTAAAAVAAAANANC